MTKLLTATAKWYEDRKHWKINVQKDGARRSFYSSTPGRRGKAECESKAWDWIDSNTVNDPIFESAWDRYRDSRKAKVGTSAIRSDESIGKCYLLPALRKKKLSRITVQDWQDILNTAAKAGKHKATIDDIRTRMTGFRKFCKKKRWPCEDMDLLENPSDLKSEKHVLSRADVRRIFATSTVNGRRDPYWNAYRLAIVQGYRRGEIAGMMWEDYKDGWLKINRSVNRYGEITQGKNARARRLVKLTPTAVKIIEDQKAFLGEIGLITPYIFPDIKTGKPNPNGLYDAWIAYLDCNGIERVTFHEIRHTMISLCRADVPKELLKAAVGHSDDMDTFGIYGHQMEEDYETTASDIEAVMSGVIGTV